MEVNKPPYERSMPSSGLLKTVDDDDYESNKVNKR